MILNSLISFGQKPKPIDFKINGKINIDTGIVELHLYDKEDSVHQNIEKITARVISGKFQMTGKIQNPILVGFKFGSSYLSYRTVLDTGAQSITLNVDSNYEEPKNTNAVTQESVAYNAFFKEVFNKGSLQRMERNKIYDQYGNDIPYGIELKMMNDVTANGDRIDSVTLNYVKLHPNSYYALSTLVSAFLGGYRPVLETAVDTFSDNLKESTMWQMIFKKMNMAKRVSKGNTFPDFVAYTQNKQPLNKAVYAKNRYTLIDFWYSSCGPCIAQAPQLAKIRSTFISKGFDIVGISIDNENKRQAWLDAIEKHSLTWPQFIDLGGVETSKLNIHVFPTNFLLDETGTIVAVNLLPIQIHEFLKTHLD
ncbi:redoxin family protein [Pedobacter sp. AW1-32]|uniref:redoxin family protein n=1 Tax=Pedobacter sp. AW1-32 TaxID=3383026 RepID=UPI003FEE8E2F